MAGLVRESSESSPCPGRDKEKLSRARGSFESTCAWRKSDAVIGVGATFPHSRKHPRHHERHAPRFPSPAVEECWHQCDLRLYSTNETTRPVNWPGRIIVDD